MYAVTATVTHGALSRQVPTSYLDERVQGILDEDGARVVAQSILDPLLFEDVTLDITAVRV